MSPSEGEAFKLETYSYVTYRDHASSASLGQIACSMLCTPPPQKHSKWIRQMQERPQSTAIAWNPATKSHVVHKNGAQ